jgi:hypothetical protein
VTIRNNEHLMTCDETVVSCPNDLSFPRYLESDRERRNWAEGRGWRNDDDTDYCKAHAGDRVSYNGRHESSQ